MADPLDKVKRIAMALAKADPALFAELWPGAAAELNALTRASSEGAPGPERGPQSPPVEQAEGALRFSEEALELLLKDMTLNTKLAKKSDREIAHLLRTLWDHAAIASATGAVLHQAIDRLWRASGGPMTDEDDERVMNAQEAESGP